MLSIAVIALSFALALSLSVVVSGPVKP